MTGAGTWEQKIAAHLAPDGSVLVPPRIARWLETTAGITADQRSRLRDSDPAASAVLMALHCAATQPVSVCGPKLAVVDNDQPELNAWLTPAEAAKELGVTAHCVRTLCRTGRLPATRKGKSWLIRRADIHIRRLTA